MTTEYFNEIDKFSESSKVESSKDSAGKVIGGLGSSQPFIKINGYTFSTREMKKFTLNVEGFYPKSTLILRTNSGNFLTTAFPKDGDVMSVFIRSLKDTFKPIRLDFLITKVTAGKSKDPEGDSMLIKINGILKIPKLYSETCQSISNKTSYEALFDIATKLQLGFATNTKKESFKDKMNWISPYSTYLDWIKNITEHSYCDDTSFFATWIDQYLNLNFVDLNKNMSILDDFKSKDGLAQSTLSTDKDHESKLVHNKVKLVLTNERTMKSTNYYFNKFEIINNSGAINLVNGYIRHMYWYNKIDKKIWDWKVEPILTEGSSSSKVVMLGRSGEENWKDEIKYKYCGVQYSLPDHNAHAYWKHSKIQNFQNLNFINKIKIILNLPNANPNLYRGMIIPVTFMLTQESDRIVAGSKKEDDAKNVGMSLDRFLSGNYTILGINYHWAFDREERENTNLSSGTWRQEVIIGRREWTVPDNIKND